MTENRNTEHKPTAGTARRPRPLGARKDGAPRSDARRWRPVIGAGPPVRLFDAIVVSAPPDDAVADPAEQDIAAQAPADVSATPARPTDPEVASPDAIAACAVVVQPAHVAPLHSRLYVHIARTTDHGLVLLGRSARLMSTAARQGRRWSAGPSLIRRRGVRVAACVLGVTAVVAAVATAMMLRTPGWYVVPRVPEAQHQAVRNDLERMTDRFSMALLEREPFDIQFTHEQLNTWLTLRGRIWPEAERFIPSDWRGPLLRFKSGRVAFGAQYRAAPGEPVVWIELSLGMDGDEILIRPTGLWIGSMRVPVRWLSRWAKELRIAERAQNAGTRLRGNVEDGFRLGTRHTWWNGRRDFRITDITIDKGELSLGIEPLGPQPRRSAISRR